MGAPGASHRADLDLDVGHSLGGVDDQRADVPADVHDDTAFVTRAVRRRLAAGMRMSMPVLAVSHVRGHGSACSAPTATGASSDSARLATTAATPAAPSAAPPAMSSGLLTPPCELPSPVAGAPIGVWFRSGAGVLSPGLKYPECG